MPLADAYALFFTMPLIITALSVPLLGEPVGPGAGCRRGGLSGRADRAAAGQRAHRARHDRGTLGRLHERLRHDDPPPDRSTDNPEAAAFYGDLAILLVMALALPFVLILPAPGDLALSALGDTFGGTAYLLLAHAYKRAPAALVAPFQYADALRPRRRLPPLRQPAPADDADRRRRRHRERPLHPASRDGAPGGRLSQPTARDPARSVMGRGRWLGGERLGRERRQIPARWSAGSARSPRPARQARLPPSYSSVMSVGRKAALSARLQGAQQRGQG